MFGEGWGRGPKEKFFSEVRDQFFFGESCQRVEGPNVGQGLLKAGEPG